MTHMGGFHNTQTGAAMTAMKTIRRLFDSKIGRRYSPSGRHRSRKVQLAVTNLEERRVPAGTIALSADTGILSITGNGQRDQAIVTADAGVLSVTLAQVDAAGGILATQT